MLLARLCHLKRHSPQFQPHSVRVLAFQQAGLDSLGVVDLRNAVAAGFGIDLPATAAFDYPTVAALAAHIAQESAAAAAAQPESTAAAGADGYWRGLEAGGSPAAEAAEAESSGGGSGVSSEQVLAGVRAAVADALGASIGDDEPLMEVRNYYFVPQ